MSLDAFKNTTPVFRPEAFFDGELEGWATLESPVGGLQRRATIKAKGRYDEAGGTIRFSETYTFDDGHVDTVNWVIRPVADNRYEGEEPTVEGKAEGERAGCAFHWSYTRNTRQKDGSTTKLNFDDWFYMIDERGCMVRGTIGRLGLPFAIAHVCYRKIG